MRTAEQALRAKAIALLAADAELAGVIHGVFDGMPPRASAPCVSVGSADGGDWGTKDRAGCEIRLAVTLYGVGDSLDDRAAARVEAVVAGLRGAAEDWTVISARIVRTRFALAREGGWRRELVVRCRCLAGDRG